MRQTLFIIPFLLVFGLVNIFGQTKTEFNKIPENTKFVTSDIDNFWRAFDLAKKETELEKKVKIFQREYIDKGSIGLKGFMPYRIVIT